MTYFWHNLILTWFIFITMTFLVTYFCCDDLLLTRWPTFVSCPIFFRLDQLDFYISHENHIFLHNLGLGSMSLSECEIIFVWFCIVLEKIYFGFQFMGKLFGSSQNTLIAAWPSPTATTPPASTISTDYSLIWAVLST